MSKTYQLEFTETFEEAFKGLKESFRKRIKLKLEELKTNPYKGKKIFETGGVKLNLMAIRVGRYRIFYVVEEGSVTIILISLDIRGDNTYRRKEIKRIVTAYLRYKQTKDTSS